MVQRRTLLKLVATLVPTSSALRILPGCAGSSALLFLDAREQQALTHLVDLVIPKDDGRPGASDFGAVGYIDRFLSGEGLVFASGPFSGRTPFPDERGRATGDFPDDDFLVAEPLDRVQRAAIRSMLFGRKAGALGDGDPGERGLRTIFRDGLKGVTDQTTLDGIADGGPEGEEFVDVLVQLTCEGAWAAPEYGGNVDMQGWHLIHYEGDLMPLGFSTFDEVAGVYRERPEAPVSTPDNRLDPEPLDEDVAAFLSTTVELLGGTDTKKRNNNNGGG